MCATKPRAHLSAAKLLDDSIRVCSSLSRRFCLPWLLLAPNQPLKRGKFISPGYNLHSAPMTLCSPTSFPA